MKNPTIFEKIPKYLHPYIATQDPGLYTAMDHASWRFIMRCSKSYFSKHAHQKYLDGLKETGISTDHIPLISDMDQKLSQFGWRAVPVCGFIPPAAFMEFLSLGVLPIACDMRAKEHLAYTPAPDIVHEAAGHAPIIADAEYADYLLSYGELARKVIFSDQDMNVYEAIRLLSEVKENPESTQKDIDRAQRELDTAIAAVTFISEAQEFSRMAWWTLEYGLVGDLKNPKIYGAGLLSSMSESISCLKVKHIPFSIECIEYGYDITKPQPQLFVARDFDHLSEVLKQLEAKMAFRRGGLEGLEKAFQAKTVTTVEFDTGVQVSGVLNKIHLDSKKKPAYLNFSGPSQVAYRDFEIEGQGAAYHSGGFGCPVGLLKDGRSLATLSDLEIKKILKEMGKLEFQSGVEIVCQFKNAIRNSDLLQVLVVQNCTITFNGIVLFKPEWDDFDLACGSKVISVFGGAADRDRYFQVTGGYRQKSAEPKTNLTEKNKDLNELFRQVAELRERKDSKSGVHTVFKKLESDFPDEWLLRLELLEFKSDLSVEELKALRSRLDAIGKKDATSKTLIERGLELV